MLETPVVGVMDSGVGGLSVLAALRRRLPGLQYCYLSDNLHFPYGGRSEQDIVECAQRVAPRFVQKCSLDILVIACNTMSTVALPYLRQQLAVPIVGVVPAIKPAAQRSKTGTIALLATMGTIQRPYTDSLIMQFAGQCRVIKTGSSQLVEAAERKLRGIAPPRGLVAAELAPLFAASPQEPERRVDVVVLGCTHFPLLQSELAEAAAWPVTWLDSGEAIAARTAHLIAEKGWQAPAEEAPEPMMAYFTKADPGVDELKPTLEALGFEQIGLLY